MCLAAKEQGRKAGHTPVLTCLAHAAAAQHHQLDDLVGRAVQRGVLRDGQQQEVGGVLRHRVLRDEEHARRDGCSARAAGEKQERGSAAPVLARLCRQPEALSSHCKRSPEECESARPPAAAASAQTATSQSRGELFDRPP